jgi:hypothetical protein
VLVAAQALGEQRTVYTESELQTAVPMGIPGVRTTNLDAQRPVLWNMGAIAASGRPEALELFRFDQEFFFPTAVGRIAFSRRCVLSNVSVLLTTLDELISAVRIITTAVKTRIHRVRGS